ncbi:MAG TPA: regulatory protein RecX [Candidatus Limnocylindrales bacterium]
MTTRRRELPAAKRERLAQVDDPQVVLDAALRFLETRQRSVAEVRRRLGHAGYRGELVEGAIERLLALGILDDEAFAAAWVASRDRASPRGEHVLMLELRQKGIDPAIVSATLVARREAAATWDGEAGDAADPGEPEEPPATPDEAGARRLLARHARALERVADPRVRRQRAYALLARKGFGPDVASAISREWLAGAAVADGAEGPGEDGA